MSVIEFKTLKHKKDLQATLLRLEDMLKKLDASLKSLQVYREYATMKSVLIEINSAKRVYFSMYKSARDKLKELETMEKENGES
jgi:division protein CdvB (Snf7/Vps24/ESCRT-III family)